MRAETADRAFLDRDQDLVVARELEHELGVQRLHEARIRDRGREAVSGELVGGLLAFGKARAEGEQGDLAALADDAALADLERNADFRHLDAAAFAARIAQRTRTIVDRDLG